MLQITNEQGIVALDPGLIIQMVEGHCVAGSSDLTPAPGAGDMEVEVDPGTFYLGEQEVDYAGGSVTLDTGDSDPRKDLITVGTDGALDVFKGTPASTRPSDEVREATWQPSPVDVTGYTGLPIAEVWVAADATAIQSADIRDRRVSREMLSNNWVQALANFDHDDSFSGYPLDLVQDTEAQNYPLAHGTDTDTPASAHHNRPAAGTNLQDDADTFNVEQGKGSGLNADLVRDISLEEQGITLVEGFEDGLTDYTGDTGAASIITSWSAHGEQALQMESVDGATAAVDISQENMPISPLPGTRFATALKINQAAQRSWFDFARQNGEYYRLQAEAPNDRMRLFYYDGAAFNTILEETGVNVSGQVGEVLTFVVDWGISGDFEVSLLDGEDILFGHGTATDTNLTSGGGMQYGTSTTDGTTQTGEFDFTRLIDPQLVGAQAVRQPGYVLRADTADNVPPLEPGQSVWVEDEERYYYEDGN